MCCGSDFLSGPPSNLVLLRRVGERLELLLGALTRRCNVSLDPEKGLQEFGLLASKSEGQLEGLAASHAWSPVVAPSEGTSQLPSGRVNGFASPACMWFSVFARIVLAKYQQPVGVLGKYVSCSWSSVDCQNATNCIGSFLATRIVHCKSDLIPPSDKLVLPKRGYYIPVRPLWVPACREYGECF